jgi:hypothetical protein
MHYIKVVTSKKIVYLCHYDPDKDGALFDKLIDKGYKIEKQEKTLNSNHISAIFCESLRESIQGLL